MELVVAAAVIVLEEDATVLKPTFVAVMIERVLVAVTTEADGLALYESYAVRRKGTSTNGKKGTLQYDYVQIAKGRRSRFQNTSHHSLIQIKIS